MDFLPSFRSEFEKQLYKVNPGVKLEVCIEECLFLYLLNCCYLGKQRSMLCFEICDRKFVLSGQKLLNFALVFDIYFMFVCTEVLERDIRVIFELITPPAVGEAEF